MSEIKKEQRNGESATARFGGTELTFVTASGNSGLLLKRDARVLEPVVITIARPLTESHAQSTSGN
jgi:hypothetical protein